MSHKKNNTFYTSLTVNRAGILAWNSVPQVLIAAPAAGFIAIPIKVWAVYTYDAAVFAANTTIQVYQNIAAPTMEQSGILTAGASASVDFLVKNSAAGTTNQYISATATMTDIATGNPTPGGGGAASSITLHCIYTLMPG